MPKQITIVGLGAMGTALASKYLEKGYATTVWNRSPEKGNQLVSKGARLATSVSEALEASTVIVVCLADESAVEETLSKATTILAGKLVVDLTSGTPNQARKISNWATSFNAEYINGGIMAVPAMIGSPHAMILYSGRSTTAFHGVENDLSVLASARFLGNDPGSASLYDIALLSGMYGLFSGFLHATALVKSEPGNTATEFLSLLIPWLSAMTNQLGSLAKQIDEGDYTSQGSDLAMQALGMKTMYAASEEQGVSPEVILPIKSLMERAVKNGHGDAALSALIEYFALGSRK